MGMTVNSLLQPSDHKTGCPTYTIPRCGESKIHFDILPKPDGRIVTLTMPRVEVLGREKYVGARLDGAVSPGGRTASTAMATYPSPANQVV